MRFREGLPRGENQQPSERHLSAAKIRGRASSQEDGPADPARARRIATEAGNLDGCEPFPRPAVRAGHCLGPSRALEETSPPEGSV